MADRSPPTRRTVALTVLLATCLFLALSRFAERHVGGRVDLSQDQLSGWSPAALRVVERLDDVLAVELVMTARPELAAAQLHRRRLLDRFDELVARAKDKISVVHADPSESYQDRLRAQSLGLAPLSLEDWAGTSRVTQDVWFAAVLRYRGNEEVLPFLHPQTLEYDLASAIWRLTQDRRARVGWMVGELPADDGKQPVPDGGFSALRLHLERRFQVVEVFGLASGVQLPEQLDALVCLAPRALPARAAFEIEEFVRAGGALLVLSDRSRAQEDARRIEGYDTGLEPLFAAWGAPQDHGPVWDRGFATPLSVLQSVGVSGATRTVTVDYPLWPTIKAGGLAADSPVTARLRYWPLRWAHPFTAAEPIDGLVRTSLARSSDSAWVVELDPQIRVDGASIDGLTKELIARFPPQQHDVAVALVGRFPSAFEGVFGPPVVDHSSGADIPGTERRRRESQSEPARVALIGDSDWARNEVVADREGRGFTGAGRISALLMENLVDWLTQSDELVDLRARVPRDRRLIDFDARAQVAEGVEQAENLSGRTAAAQRAKDRAASQRRRYTLASYGGSMLLVGLLVTAAVMRRRSPTLVSDARVDGGVR